MKCLCLCLKSLESNCWLTALAELKDLTVASFKLWKWYKSSTASFLRASKNIANGSIKYNSEKKMHLPTK